MEDYEKKYKQALERARKLYNEAKVLEYNQDMEDYEIIFPELAENEDEKIRKEILDYIKTGTYKKDWIAWLEKHKPVEWSEEDERMLISSIAAIYAADYYDRDDKDKMDSWLKSLKERMKS